MASTDQAKEEAILPPDAFEYLKKIKPFAPEYVPSWQEVGRKEIPPPSHRVMKYKAKLECAKVVSMVERAYSLFPWYPECCFKELLQWLHRFDFTQDDETAFHKFLIKIRETYCPGIFDPPILQTETHKFFLHPGPWLSSMYVSDGKEEKHFPDEDDDGLDDESEDESEDENKNLMKLTHEFEPPLQVERDSDTEESILPLRFGLAIRRLLCFRKGGGQWDGKEGYIRGYTPYFLVFHPVDKSFWMVMDRWEDFLAYDPPHDVRPEYQDNKEMTRRRDNLHGMPTDTPAAEPAFPLAEAIRLGSIDLWFPEGLDDNKSGERLTIRAPPPTIEFSSFPKVSLFPDTDRLQVRFAEPTRLQSYLAENGVVKGRSWVSVSPADN